jgi:ribosome-associated toxin RatA of RatAB toxin-antitoxin module
VGRDIHHEGHRLIRAPVQRVWQLLSRLESHPRYVETWLSADILERSQASALVEFRGSFGGLPITSVQRVVLRPPGRIEFRQLRGTLRALSGAYLLREADDDTALTVSLVVDPGIVLFSDESAHQILAAHTETTMARIKAAAERDLVRVPSRRWQGVAAEAPPRQDETRPDGDRAAGEIPAEHAEVGPGAAGEPGEPGVGPPATGAVSSTAQAGRAEPRSRRRRRRRRRPPEHERTAQTGEPASV